MIKKRREKERKSHFPMFFRNSQCLHMSILSSSFPCSIISYFKRRIYNFICIPATRHKTINQISIIVSRISHFLLHLRSLKLNNCNSRLRQSILYKSIIVISNFINFAIVMSLDRIWIFESLQIILSDHRGFVLISSLSLNHKLVKADLYMKHIRAKIIARDRLFGSFHDNHRLSSSRATRMGT